MNPADNGPAFDSNRHLPLIYDELKRLASAQLSGEGKITLQPTALVHEAWLRLSDKNGKQADWCSRSQFFYSAAIAMKRILIERARRKNTAKRGRGWQQIHVDDFTFQDEDSDFVLDLDEALQSLTTTDPQAAAVAGLYLFGSPISDIAESLELPQSVVRRDWVYAKSFLQRELKSNQSE